jgi:hypothetical protein
MKLTKSQLRQIIKEEIENTLDENFFGNVAQKASDALHKGTEAFKGAVGIKTDADKEAARIIKKRANYLIHDMQMDVPEAEAQAADEYEMGKLDDRGNPLKGREKSVSAGVKDNPYGEKKPGTDWRGRPLTTQQARNRNRAFADKLGR